MLVRSTSTVLGRRAGVIAKVGVYPFAELCSTCRRVQVRCAMRCLGSRRGDCGVPLRRDEDLAALRCADCRLEAAGQPRPLPDEDGVLMLAAAVIRFAFEDLRPGGPGALARTKARQFLQVSVWQPGYFWGEVLGHTLIRRTILAEVATRHAGVVPASRRYWKVARNGPR